MVIKFPTKNDYDIGNVMKIGNISNIFYDRQEIQKKGENPEILLSVRPNPNRDDSKDKIYDGIFTFTLQSSRDSRELIRTETTHELLVE